VKWFRRAQPLGQRGEGIAAKALKRSGYTILDRNVQLGRYEVDIIAQEGDTIAFVEVKTRRDDQYALPEDNITHKKQQHLIRAAQRYIAQDADPSRYYRFDVAAVLMPLKGKPTVTIHRDAFQAD